MFVREQVNDTCTHDFALWSTAVCADVGPMFNANPYGQENRLRKEREHFLLCAFSIECQTAFFCHWGAAAIQRVHCLQGLIDLEICVQLYTLASLNRGREAHVKSCTYAHHEHIQTKKQTTLHCCSCSIKSLECIYPIRSLSFGQGTCPLVQWS